MSAADDTAVVATNFRRDNFRDICSLRVSNWVFVCFVKIHRHCAKKTSAQAFLRFALREIRAGLIARGTAPSKFRELAGSRTSCGIQCPKLSPRKLCNSTATLSQHRRPPSDRFRAIGVLSAIDTLDGSSTARERQEVRHLRLPRHRASIG